MACEAPLYKGEHSFCLHCRSELPRTGYHHKADNPVARLFYGRVPLHAAASFLTFHKAGKVQRLIHHLKYKGQQQVGVDAGVLYGSELRESPLFADVDTIVPIPLHPSRERQRGYNQATCFGSGLAQAMGARLDVTSLVRTSVTSTQTRKSRFERWKNVEEVFLLRNPESLAGKHILLVDDVVTTGATLEACAQELLKIPNVRVSVATIAVANF
jgi:ComF family protein